MDLDKLRELAILFRAQELKDGIPTFNNTELDENFKNILGDNGVQIMRDLITADLDHLENVFVNINLPENMNLITAFQDAKKFVEKQNLKKDYAKKLENECLLGAAKNHGLDSDQQYRYGEIFERDLIPNDGTKISMDKLSTYSEAFGEIQVNGEVQKGKELKTLIDHFTEEINKKELGPAAEQFKEKIQAKIWNTARTVVNNNSVAALITSGILDNLTGLTDTLELPAGLNLNPEDAEKDLKSDTENAIKNAYNNAKNKLNTEDQKSVELYTQVQKVPKYELPKGLTTDKRKELNAQNAAFDKALDKALKEIANDDFVKKYIHEQKALEAEKVAKAVEDTKDAVNKHMAKEKENLIKLGNVLINDDPALHRNSKQYKNLKNSLLALAETKDHKEFEEQRKRVVEEAKNYLQDKYKDRSTDLGKRRFMETMNILEAASPLEAAKMKITLNTERVKKEIKKIDFHTLEANFKKTKESKNTTRKTEKKAEKKEEIKSEAKEERKSIKK